MNIKFLCQNISNNISNFTSNELEEYFEEYANDKCAQVIEETDRWLMAQTNLPVEIVVYLKEHLKELIK